MTIYPFGYLIEQSSTSATVLAPFGHLFDGDGPPPEPPAGARLLIIRQLIGA